MNELRSVLSEVFVSLAVLLAVLLASGTVGHVIHQLMSRIK